MGGVHSGVCVFMGRFGGSGWMRGLERFLVDLMEKRSYFLRTAATVGSAGLGFLVGRRRDWRSS